MERTMSRGLDVRKAEAALKRAADKALHGTREERSGRVISSLLTEIKYNPRSRNLDIRFVTGRIYRYADVPPALYQRLLEARSKGAFFNECIRDRFVTQELSGQASACGPD
jgi:lysyl-tRNA synthetase class 2